MNETQSSRNAHAQPHGSGFLNRLAPLESVDRTAPHADLDHGKAGSEGETQTAPRRIAPHGLASIKTQSRRTGGADSDATSLYRCFSADGDLLYVGVSTSAILRLGAHSRGSVWWSEVASVSVAHFDRRRDALAAEQYAIADERPLYNVVHRAVEVGSRGGPAPESYRGRGEPWLALADAAGALGIHEAELAAFLARGLPHWTLDGELRVRLSEITPWLRRRAVA